MLEKCCKLVIVFIKVKNILGAAQVSQSLKFNSTFMITVEMQNVMPFWEIATQIDNCKFLVNGSANPG